MNRRYPSRQAAATLAVVGGAPLGHRLSGTPMGLAPASEVGQAVTYQSDWQVYRAGER